MGSSSQSGGTQTTRTEPPSYQLPALQAGLGYSAGLFNEGGPQQYGGNTIVPFAPQTETALAGIEQRATQGSPVTQTAQNFVTQGLGATPSSTFGSATNPYASPVDAGASGNPFASSANPFGGATNPYLDAAFEQAAMKSRGILDSEFARAGRNISASAPARADMLTDLASKIYAPAYENERNRQLQYQGQLTGIGASGFENAQNRQLQAGLQGQQIGAQGFENAQSRALQDLMGQRSNQLGMLGYASPLAEQDYRDLSALRGVGAEVEGQTGRIIDDNVARWDFEQNRPGMALDQYLGRISGNMGNTQTINLPKQYSNRGAGALGGAMAGGQMFNNNPWAMLGGGLLGGLFG